MPRNLPRFIKSYGSYGDNASPLKTITQDLTERLNKELQEDSIFVHMAVSYKNPSLDVVLEEMRQLNYDKIIILLSFPHYASSSSGSAIQNMEIISKWWVIPNIENVSQFYNEDFYIQTLTDQAKNTTFHLLIM